MLAEIQNLLVVGNDRNRILLVVGKLKQTKEKMSIFVKSGFWGYWNFTVRDPKFDIWPPRKKFSLT